MCASARDREALAAVQGPGPGRGAAVLAGRRVRACEHKQCGGGRPGPGWGAGRRCWPGRARLRASARSALAAARAGAGACGAAVLA